MKYFGVCFTKGGVVPDETKVKDLRAASAPENSKEALSFICMAQAVCQDFVPNFAQLAAPIYRLTHKGVKYEWTEECKKSFKEIKANITSSSLLAPFNPNKETRVTVDAAMGVGAAATLWQRQSSGRWQAVTHHSRGFTKSEKNYC